MAGILAIWHDITPEGYAEFERWYGREHLPERVGVPGFRCGRRYEAVGGDRRFFCYYEVESPAVLTSPAYLERLENPTPWTRETMKSFRGMVRTVCELELSAGKLFGSYVVVLRADAAMAPGRSARALVTELAAEDGVGRAQLWVAAAQQTRADTAEMRTRGKDALIAGALVVDCLRRADAERVAERLADVPTELGITGPAALGVYSLLCTLDKTSAL